MKARSAVLAVSSLLADLSSQIVVFVCSLEKAENLETQRREIHQTLASIGKFVDGAKPSIAPPPGSVVRASRRPPVARSSKTPPPLKLPVPKPVGRK